jgi:hypothetical protein
VSFNKKRRLSGDDERSDSKEKCGRTLLGEAGGLFEARLEAEDFNDDGTLLSAGRDA